MNAFVRQTAALSVMWAVCEMLLPQGRTRQLARMLAGLLVTAALLNTAGTLLGEKAVLPVWSQESAGAGKTNYRRMVLETLANQTADYCERYALRAGYSAVAKVWLQETGALEKAEMTITQISPLMTSQELIQRLGEELCVPPERIILQETEAP